MSVDSMKLSLPQGLSFEGSSAEMDARDSKVLTKHPLNSRTRTKRDPAMMS